MIVAFSTVLAAVIAGFLWVLDRRDRRAFEDRQADRLERAGLTGRLEALQREHRAEVAVLCQRIQAPEYAVVEHQQATVAPDGDGYPLSDEQVAEEQERVAALKRIAELETDFAGRQL